MTFSLKEIIGKNRHFWARKREKERLWRAVEVFWLHYLSAEVSKQLFTHFPTIIILAQLSCLEPPMFFRIAQPPPSKCTTAT